MTKATPPTIAPALVAGPAKPTRAERKADLQQKVVAARRMKSAAGQAVQSPLAKSGQYAGTGGRRNLWEDIPWLADLNSASYENWQVNRLGAIAALRRVVQKSQLAQAFVNAGRNNVVGDTTPRPTLSAVKNAKDRPQLEELWAKFACDPTTQGNESLLGLLRAMLASMVIDGRVFGLLRRHEDYPCGLAIMPVARDWLDAQEATGHIIEYRGPDGQKLRGQNGIVRAQSGRISHYAFLSGMDGQLQAEDIVKEQSQYQSVLRYGGGTAYQKSVIPASQVIDLYDARDATDWEGSMSHIMPAMQKLLEIARLDAALVAAMEQAAVTYGFITKSRDAQPSATLMEEEGEAYVPNPTHFVAGTIETLERGADFKPYQGQAPNAAISQYRMEIVQNIAGSLAVDYASIAGDTKGSNYTSLRHAAILAREGYKALQATLETKFLRPILKALIDTAQLRGDISITNESYRVATMTEWRQKAFPWVDPYKDVLAAAEAIKLGIESPQRLALTLGRDWHQIQDELAEAKARADEAGIPFPPDQPSQPKSADGTQGQMVGAAMGPPDEAEGGSEAADREARDE